MERVEPHTSESAAIAQRKEWLSVLSRASEQELLVGFDRLGGIPEAHDVKPAVVGSVMIEARAGGSGQRFNAIEATVTRCVVQVDQRLGVSYALGRDTSRARLSAIADALLQGVQNDKAAFEAMKSVLVAPVAYRIESKRREKSRKAAATKVEFFTMVRGE